MGLILINCVIKIIFYGYSQCSRTLAALKFVTGECLIYQNKVLPFFTKNTKEMLFQIKTNHFQTLYDSSD